MEDLKTLFKQRDDFVNEKTLELFSRMTNTLACVTTYFSEMDELISQGMISWEETSIIDDLVVVVGMVQYEVGDVLTFEGETNTVTEENVDLFQRVVHMSVPIDLVEENDPDKIMEFLDSLGEGRDIDEFSESFAAVEIIPQEEHEFDLSELTEEQRRNLKHFTDTSKN